MALIRYGGGIIQMSGSIAGNTYARNRYGNYARARTKPVNPNSSSPLLGRDPDDGSQAKVRSAIAALSARWSQTLTSDQRTAWNLYASNVAMKNKLGETVYLSGYNHYIRSNTIRMAYYGRSFDDGPTVFELPAKDPTIIFQPEVHEQKCKLTFDDTMDWCDEDDAAIQIWEGVPQNPQRNFFAGPFLGIKDKGGSSGDPPTSPEWFTNLHTLAVGEKVWYKIRIRRADGRLSEPFYANAIVVAGPIP